jgi:hypothetical protein
MAPASHAHPHIQSEIAAAGDNELNKPSGSFERKK